jgi:ABC-type lipoprotein release transport system permease subunit
VGDAARIVIAGLLLGVLAAMYASQRAAGLLFNVAPWDRSVFGGVLAILLIVALIAASIPALRALRIHPNAALKEE